MVKHFLHFRYSGGAWLGGSVVDVAGARGGLWLVIAAAWAILAVVLIGFIPLRNSLRRAYKRRLVTVDLHMTEESSPSQNS